MTKTGTNKSLSKVLDHHEHLSKVLDHHEQQEQLQYALAYVLLDGFFQRIFPLGVLDVGGKEAI